MSTVNNHIHTRKQWPGLLVAFGVTLVLGLIIFALGINALFNTSATPVQAAGATDSSVSVDQATLEQLQGLIDQYQTREQQFQTELQQAADQINAANGQIEQYQRLFTALQNAGIIQISPDGQVFVNPGGFGGRQFERNDD